MQVYQFVENANVYSVPFDWNKKSRPVDYIKEIIETKFDKKLRVGEEWKPDFFGIVNPKQKLGDLGTLVGSDAIIMNQRTVNALFPLIEQSVELLPYETEVGTYYLVNVLDEGEYLDRAKTECDEIVPDGRCYGINKYVFDARKLYNKHIFRIPDDPVFRYVSGEFIEACRRHKLEGIYLTDKTKVWDSDQT